MYRRQEEVRAFIDAYLTSQDIKCSDDNSLPGEPQTYWRFVYHDHFIGHFLFYEMPLTWMAPEELSPWLLLRLDMANFSLIKDSAVSKVLIQSLKMNADSEGLGYLAICDGGVISNVVNLPLVGMNMDMIKQEVMGFLASGEAAFSILNFHCRSVRPII